MLAQLENDDSGVQLRGAVHVSVRAIDSQLYLFVCASSVDAVQVFQLNATSACAMDVGLSGAGAAVTGAFLSAAQNLLQWPHS